MLTALAPGGFLWMNARQPWESVHRCTLKHKGGIKIGMKAKK